MTAATTATSPVGMPLPAACAGVPSAAVLKAAGEALTYRQLNHWTVLGLLGEAHLHPDGPTGRRIHVGRDEVRGSGYRMCYTQGQVLQAVFMARLIAATHEDGQEPLPPRVAARLWHGRIRGEVAGRTYVMTAWEEIPTSESGPP